MPEQIEGVIFDMDGTIIESLLDFDAIRAELGIPPGEQVLEAIDAMDPAPRAEAHRILLHREMEAGRKAKLDPHALETLQTIRNAGLKTALLTRHAQQVLKIIIEKFTLEFDLAWSREDGPIKPGPEGVLRGCKTLNIDPKRTVCVGDFRYDILAANAAGAVSVLLVRAEPPPYVDEADYVIADLGELLPLLGI